MYLSVSSHFSFCTCYALLSSSLCLFPFLSSPHPLTHTKIYKLLHSNTSCVLTYTGVPVRWDTHQFSPVWVFFMDQGWSLQWIKSPLCVFVERCGCEYIFQMCSFTHTTHTHTHTHTHTLTQTHTHSSLLFHHFHTQRVSSTFIVDIC